ncbi:MAG TPA: hypothetical protein VN372_10675 [Methanospirillum sp.]|nr:hypothetical protein [Methanospirillum sp.]
MRKSFDLRRWFENKVRHKITNREIADGDLSSSIGADKNYIWIAIIGRWAGIMKGKDAEEP